MGAKISGIASNMLVIEGVDYLGGTEHTMLPDMIEVGSFIGLAAMTQSSITIKGAGLEHLGVIPGKFAQLGIQMEFRGDDIYIPSQELYEIEKYMDGGGGWLGFHVSAYTDKNTKWPWFNNFMGGAVYHNNVWPPLTARLLVDDPTSPVTKRIPPAFASPADEWYQWNPSPRLNKDIKVLVTMDPGNYPIGIKNIITEGDVPVVWTNSKYNMIYMSIGHSGQTMSDHLQNFMIADAMMWLGRKK